MADQIEIYLDETFKDGCAPELIAMWFTWRPEIWRSIVADAKRANRCFCELHFSKISRKTNDPRFLAARRIFIKLSAYRRSWYARAVYCGPQTQQHLLGAGPKAAYEQVLDELVKSRTGRIPDKSAVLVLDGHTFHTDDAYLPRGLEQDLNDRSRRLGGPPFRVASGFSDKDDLLQVTDLLAGALRQHYAPSENANKSDLAALAWDLVGDRIYVDERP